MTSNIYVNNSNEVKIYSYTTKADSAYLGQNQIWKDSYPVGHVLLQTSTPDTYTVEVLYDCTCNLIMVGGGCGGVGYTYKVSSPGTVNPTYYDIDSGGSGAYIHGTITLTPGTYTIVVGRGGTGRNYSGTGSGYLGTATTAFGQSANGGGFNSNAGTTVTIGTLTGEAGNKGTSTGGIGSGSWVAGAASKYGGYGVGGGASSSSYENGGNGYISLIVT